MLGLMKFLVSIEKESIFSGDKNNYFLIALE